MQDTHWRRPLFLFAAVAALASGTGCQHLPFQSTPRAASAPRRSTGIGDWFANAKQATSRTLKWRKDAPDRLDRVKQPAGHQLATHQRADRGNVDYHSLALMYDKLGSHRIALPLYDRALAQHPENADIYCDLGYSCYLAEDLPQAEKNLRKSVRLAPDLARAHNNLGVVLGEMGQPELAIQEFHAAGCSAAQCRVHLAMALMRGGRGPEAIDQLQRALVDDRSLETATVLLANMDARHPKAANRDEPTNIQTDVRDYPMAGEQKVERASAVRPITFSQSSPDMGRARSVEFQARQDSLSPSAVKPKAG